MKIIDDGDLTAIDEMGGMVAWVDGGWLDEIAEKKSIVSFQYRSVHLPFIRQTTLTLEKEDDKVTYTCENDGEKLSAELPIHEWQRFITAIYDAGVLNLQKNYHEPMCDGHVWHIIIKKADGTIFESSGQNAYPDNWKAIMAPVHALIAAGKEAEPLDDFIEDEPGQIGMKYDKPALEKAKRVSRRKRHLRDYLEGK
jgi:hypothetical protein